MEGSASDEMEGPAKDLAIDQGAEAGPSVPAESDSLDLVCNEYLLVERMTLSQRISSQLIKGIRPVFLLTGATLTLIPIFILVLLLVAFWSFGTMFVATAHSIAGQLVGCLLYLLVLALLFPFVSRLMAASGELKFMPFPTNIRISGYGLSFAWLSQSEQRSYDIPWLSIKSVSMRSTRDDRPDQALAGIVLDFEIDLRGFGLLRSLAIVTQTCALWTLRPGIPRKRLSISFPLDSLTLEADKFRLLSAVKERCAHSSLSERFTDLIEYSKAPTFTQLWLDDMQSFRRQSVHELPLGSALQGGRYQIEGRIATGGQAKVYRAVDTQSNSVVALKELVLPVNAGADVRNRAFANVKKEAILLAQLEHPGILKLLDHFVEDHRAYLVLEFIEGKSLRHLVQAQGALPAEQVASIAVMICEILEYLHRLSPPVVHRDLAPDNLMMTDRGKVMLLDFNVAQQLESSTTKTVVGKHNYMAPEQFKGKPCTQSDLYSLGGTLYYLLTGADPLPLSCSRPSALSAVPQELDDIVARLTALELLERYQDASVVLADIRKSGIIRHSESSA